jgi:hypothetical protein
VGLVPEVADETEEDLNSTVEIFDEDEDYFTYSNLSVDVEPAPVINSVPGAIVKIGENLNFTVKTSNMNGDSLIYSASNLPTGASFDRETGLFSWTPANGQEGLYTIFFEMSDGMFNNSEVATISVVKEVP